MRYSDLPAEGMAAHSAETRYRPGERIGEHVHDFAEIFFITEGRGFQIINGHREHLVRGDLRVIRPEDSHSLGTAETMTITNVAFPAEHLTRLVAQFPPEAGYLWSDARSARVERPTLSELALLYRRLVATPASAVRLERLLVAVVDAIESARAPREGARGAGIPAWLGRALETMSADPELLQEGLGALVRLTGRSADHIGRVCKAGTGTTATGVLNRLRLDRAARLLASPTEGIADIALEAGFSNLSYFYRRFRERFGVSPRKYREAAQRPVRG